MRNIWLLNHYASKEGRHTFFARELVERGYNVTLFASSFMHNIFKEAISYPSGTYFTCEETEDGYNRVWIKTPPYEGNNYKRLLNQFYFAIRCIKAGKKLELDRPDVIVGSSVHPFTGFSAYNLSKKYGVPFIFEVRDLWPQTLIDLGVLKEKSLAAYLFRKLEIFLYKKSSLIISVLPDGADYISSLGIKRVKVVHIPNGIDLKWFDKMIVNTPDNDSLKELLSGKKDKLIFTYTGAMGPANGLNTLIDAINILKSQTNIYERVVFLLVGDGSDKKKLEDLVKKSFLDNIVFTGYIDRIYIPCILSNSDFTIAIVKKSYVHRFGVSMNKIFDYLASSKPMISAIGAPFDFAEKSGCGLAIQPDEPKILVKAIIKMCEMDDDERVRMGFNGRKYVEENHEFSILTDRLVEVFEECIDLLKD